MSLRLGPCHAAGLLTFGSTPWIVGTAVTGYTVSARTSGTQPSPTAGAFQWFRDAKPDHWRDRDVLPADGS